MSFFDRFRKKKSSEKESPAIDEVKTTGPMIAEEPAAEEPIETEEAAEPAADDVAED